MKKKIKKICIVGAGWYGCHLGYKLSKLGYDIDIIEKNKKIFEGSSGFNQFRLHTGYHYPRSAYTINEIKENFKKFIKEYKKFIFFPKNNIYCIANKNSLIDFETYINILKFNNLKFKKKSVNYLRNIEGSINSNEGVFLNEKIIKFYLGKLRKKIQFGKFVKNFDEIKKKYDLVIDCSNNTIKNNFKNNVKYICTISLIYKLKKGKNSYPITIMDGKLPSLYPYSSKKNTFTLTHSKYTHIKKFNDYSKLNEYKKKISKKYISEIKNKMENDFSFYHKNFKSFFLYKGYFLSYKVIPGEASDKRPLYVNRNKNVISFFSPKISNIFTAEKIILKILNRK